MKLKRIVQFIASAITLGNYPAIWQGGIYQGPLKQGCVPILNCWGCPLSLFSCPIGALQHFFNLHLIPSYIAGFFGAIGTVVGRMACGWLCPFGLFQDLIYKLKTFKMRMPKFFSYIKYGVLIVIAGIIAWISGEPWFCKLCPAGYIEAGIPLVLADKTGDIKALVGWLFWIKMAILIIIINFSIFIKRFFCRAFCPIGAIYSIFNKFSMFQMKIDKEKCINCDSCQAVCPMHVPIQNSPHNIDCIRCLDCVKKCPTKAISYGAK